MHHWIISYGSLGVGKLSNGTGAVALPECLLWSYVVQLSSALRSIHSCGLAARTMDPSKILVVGQSKYERIPLILQIHNLLCMLLALLV